MTRETINHINANLTWLKTLAIIAMLWDHLAYRLALHTHIIAQDWYIAARTPGRICMPIFAFLIAWNYTYNTRDPMKYIQRLALFALACEPIYILYFGYPGNAFLPLAIGAGLTHYTATTTTHRRTKITAMAILAITTGIAFHAPEITAEAFMIPLIAYHLRTSKTAPIAIAAALTPILNGLCWQFYAAYALTAVLIAACTRTSRLPPIRYNKWLAYGFYPLHLTILFGIFGPA